ncbi:MAG: transposase, partial [Candidatus Marinimicrobia bacterium]|nr:transposase [Candidatus Neomarinimicrobiota bacterium]
LRRTRMKRNRFTDEQIVAALRDAEATTVVEAARKHGVAEQTMYRWRKRFVGMEVSDVRELKRFKDENARLKKLLAERDLEVEVMKEIQAKKW